MIVFLSLFETHLSIAFLYFFSITLNQIFNDADVDSKGFLEKDDLKIAIISLLGYKPSKVKIFHEFKRGLVSSVGSASDFGSEGLGFDSRRLCCKFNRWER